MNWLTRLFLIIDLKAIVITILSIFSTYLCIRFELIAEFPFTLVATAVVFPIVFSISGADKRRETALERYADLKAHGRAIFLASRDWLDKCDVEAQNNARPKLQAVLAACRTLFTSPLSAMPENESRVYAAFSELSEFVRTDLRGRGLASGEVSRCNQYVSKMLMAFESTKHIYPYRTPRSLQAFSDFFVKTLPILYGPYFAQVANESTGGLEYITPVLFSLVLVSLDNIQAHLENPFDLVGEDDVVINVEKFLASLDVRTA
jgi:hypothetical protein